MNNTSTLRKKKSFPFGRYGEIISILIKYGFSDLVSTLENNSFLSRFFLFWKKDSSVNIKLSRWERVRLATEELGPTFIKLGQFMSNRPDILPVALISELEKLQDSVKPVEFQELIPMLETSFKKKLSQIFIHFSEQPIASASIAQVYEGTLVSGQKVAIKVQRPKIIQRIGIDIEILFHVVYLIERQYEKIRSLRLRQLVNEFQQVLDKELDFTIESMHLERFRKNFKFDRHIYFPKVYHEFTSKKILVTEFIEGSKISQLNTVQWSSIDQTLLAQRGAQCILKQIFDHGFFHADPHPGNILIKQDGTLCFLDFGAVGMIAPTLRHYLSVLLYGVVNKDPYRIVRILQMLSNQPIRDMHDLEYEISEFIEHYSMSMLRDINIGDMLRKFFSILINHNLRIVPGFYLLLKTLITVEGVGVRLDPDFNMMHHLEPFIKKMIITHPRLKYLPFDMFFSALDFSMLLKDFPADSQEIIRQIKAGEIRINFQHKGLEPLIRKADQLVNSIVFSIVLAALIIGSSVVVLSGIPPKFYDIPVIGVVGFVLAGIIGFSLLFSMIHRKKM